jgi:hypothetical protein
VNRQTESQTAASTWSDAEPAIESPLQPRGPGGPAGLRTDWPLWRIVLGLAIWPLLEQFMMAAVWFVDSALAGHLPPDIVKPASDAVGAAVYMMWLMGLMQGAVGVGATALVARTIGGGRFAEAETAVGQAMLLALVWGGFNAVLFFAISRPVGVFLNLQPEAMAFCTEYLRILAVVAPLRAVLFIGAAALRGAGDTRSPFYVMLLVNLINIAVSIALVAEFSPIGGMGVRGIALGTAAAWTVGDVGPARPRPRRRATAPARAAAPAADDLPALPHRHPRPAGKRRALGRELHRDLDRRPTGGARPGTARAGGAQLRHPHRGLQLPARLRLQRRRRHPRRSVPRRS